MSRPILIRATWGALLLIAPGPVVGVLPGQRRARSVCNIARVLGLRQVSQALILDRHPTRGRALAGAAVDLAHAISMLALAPAEPKHRTLLLADAALASTFAAAGVRRARSVS